MNDIMIFNNPEFGEVRTVMIDNEPWFVAKDIANVLKYSKTFSMMKRIDSEDKRNISSSNLEEQIGALQRSLSAGLLPRFFLLSVRQVDIISP